MSMGFVIAWLIFAFGFGALGWLILAIFPISALSGLLIGRNIMNDKRLEKDDDKYQASLLAKSEQRVRESLDAETAHTEDQ